MTELTLRLSPGGRWLAVVINTADELTRLSIDVPQTGPFKVVADDVVVSQFARQRVVRCRLDHDREAPAVHEATRSDDSVEDVVVLDDGTVIGARHGCREIFEWRPGAERRDRPLFKRLGESWMYLRRDSRQLVILHNPWCEGDEEDEDDAAGAPMYALDPTEWKLDRLPDLRSHVVLGWTRDQTHLIAYETAERFELVRIDLRSGKRETLANHLSPLRQSASPAWLACSHLAEDGSLFTRIPTALDGTATSVPALNGLHPVSAIDDDRFLCVSEDCSRYVIADLRVGNVTAVLPLPPLPFHYSAALGAVVTCREDACEVWSLEGALQKSIAFAT